MKRKILAALLCACMLLGVSGAALAEAAANDQALMAVTAKVKATLGLDTEVYDEFQGSSSQDVLLGTRWHLEWSADGRSLFITADDSGKVYSYSYRYAAAEEPVAVVDGRYLGGGRLNIPQLPEDKSQAAYQAAVDFLSKVLAAPVETVELENGYRPALTQNSYRYSGTVLLNGLESPITCSVTVQASDLAVTRFWRNDEGSGYLGGIPAPGTAVTDAQALSKLTSTIKMEAKYILQKDSKTARVEYVPVSGDQFYVDGATGELVNLTELRDKLWRTGDSGNKYMFNVTAADAAPEAAMGGSLTKAEQEGAAILTGALSKEELDRVVKRAWPEIGLDKYTLATASYSVRETELPEGAERTPEDHEVTCRLTYGRQITGGTANKYVTVDAKTGALKSLYSSRSYQEKWPESFSVSTSSAAAKPVVQKVLAAFAGDNYGKLGLFDTDDAKENNDWEHTFTFQQTANGYFYDGNAYTVGVDATDGTVSALSGHFDPEVELATPAKVIDLRAATKTYANAMALHYGYMEIPVSVSLAGPQLMPLLKEAGYEYVTALKTGFALSQPDDRYISGVDAETGEVRSWEYGQSQDDDLTYDDIENHWVKTAAQALALFQVGFRGGSLKPAQTLTQRDMLALLLSVEGYQFDLTDAGKDKVNELYNISYSLGLVTPETRNDDLAVTRAGLVKALLDAAGYEKIAAIPGIFRCDYADAASISQSDLGYAALAQGLGLVKGGDGGEYAASRPATRAEAIAMLYQYMK